MTRGFVGRQPELARLAGVVRSRSAAFVVGEPGIGKSALCRAAVPSSAAAVGRATESASAPGRPLTQVGLAALATGGTIPDNAPPTVRALLIGDSVQHIADLSETVGVAVGHHLARLVSSARLHCVVIEDLHWADAVTLDAVAHLVESEDRGWALIATLRPEGPANAAVTRWAQTHTADRIELGPLPETDVAALAMDRLGAPDADGSVAAALAPASGLPLLIEEALADLTRRDRLRRIDAGWTVTGTGPPRPTGTLASVVSRLDALSGSSRDVLVAAALCDIDLDRPLLAAAFGEEAVSAAVRAGVSAYLLDAGGAGFRHALVHNAVLEASEHRAASLARTLLGVLTTEDLDRILLAARLAERAGETERASGLHARAGAKLLAAGLPGPAAERYQSALDLVPGRQAPELLLQRVRGLVLSGSAGPAIAESARLARLLDATGADTATVRYAAELRARAHANAGDWHAAHQAITDAAPGPDSPASTRALAALIGLERGDDDEAIRWASSVIGETIPPSEAPAACEAYEVLGRVRRSHDLPAAAEHFTKALGLAELHDLAVWRARALHELATVEQLTTFGTAALEAARGAARDAGSPGIVAAIDFHLAALHGVRFEPEAALPPARRLLEAARRVQSPERLGWAWVLIGQAHAAAGDRIRAESAAAEALVAAPENAEVRGVVSGAVLGLTSLTEGDVPRAVGEITTAVGHLRQLPTRASLPPWYLWSVIAAIHDPDHDGGARARKEVAQFAALPWMRAMGHYGIAAAALVSGDRAGAVVEFDAAANLLAAAPAFVGYQHLAHLVLAPAALDRGVPQLGRWMTEATAWAAAHGFVGLSKQCQNLARKAGVPVPRRGRGDAAVPAELARLGVTSREVDVLALVAAGLTNAEIASRLYLSPKTVKTHVERLLAKTGTANRTSLAALLPPAPRRVR